MTPVRIQRRRVKGWRMPENTVSVTRPGKWGNPHVVGSDGVLTAEVAVGLYRRDLEQRPDLQAAARRELQGKNLACYCAPGQACHADVLLAVANDGC